MKVLKTNAGIKGNATNKDLKCEHYIVNIKGVTLNELKHYSACSLDSVN